MRLVEFPLLYVKRAGLSGLALAREGSFHRTMAKNKVGTQSVGWEKLWLAPTRATTLVRFSRPLLLLLLRLRGPGSRRLLMKARAHESGISPPDGNKMTPKTTDGILSSSSSSLLVDWDLLLFIFYSNVLRNGFYQIGCFSSPGDDDDEPDETGAMESDTDTYFVFDYIPETERVINTLAAREAESYKVGLTRSNGVGSVCRNKANRKLFANIKRRSESWKGHETRRLYVYDSNKK